MVGGNGGSPFEDSSTDKALSKIIIWSDDTINKLQCEYTDGSKTAEHGASRGASRGALRGKREEFHVDQGTIQALYISSASVL